MGRHPTSELKLHQGEGKYVFKKALEPHLSNDILYRAKMGFSIPLAAWFRGPLREHVRKAVLGPTLAQTGYFNMEFLTTMVERHQSGQSDYTAPLWSLVMFEAFLRKVLPVQSNLSDLTASNSSATRS